MVCKASGIISYSYDDIYKIIKDYKYRSEIIKKYNVFIGLHRAGTLIATMMAMEYGSDKKVYMLDRNYTKSDIDNLKEKIKGQRVLLVEDVVGSGNSIKQVLDEFKDLDIKVDTFVLFADLTRNNISIDYLFLKTDKWVVPPWDAIDCRQGCSVGLDMDGLLCSQKELWVDKYLLKYKWIANIWSQFKHIFAKSLVQGKIDNPVIIITGRPDVDMPVTRWWLKKHGIKAWVFSNPYGIEKANEWKLEMIKKLHLETYIDSDADVVEWIKKNLNS